MMYSRISISYSSYRITSKNTQIPPFTLEKTMRKRREKNGKHKENLPLLNSGKTEEKPTQPAGDGAANSLSAFLVSEFENGDKNVAVTLAICNREGQKDQKDQKDRSGHKLSC